MINGSGSGGVMKSIEFASCLFGVEIFADPEALWWCHAPPLSLQVFCSVENSLGLTLGKAVI